jgi:hypothetical protein
MSGLSKAAHLALALVATSMAFAPISAHGQSAPPTVKPDETLEPQAVAALDRMGATLRGLERFSVVSDGAIESVYANGQKLESAVRTTYLVELPGRISVDLHSESSHSRLFYDGKAMTLVGVGTKKYVRFPVSGTVGEVFQRADDDFGITLPIRELFLWGSDLSDIEQPRSGFKVGETLIAGIAVEHFAFRQAEMDWQIWLEKGARPLPHKLVITRTNQPHQPRYTAYFNWNTAPDIAADDFAWTPTADYQLIDYGTAAAASAPAHKAGR